MSKISSIYLSKEDYERLMRVCDKEDCTAYSLVKRLLLDHISNYPLGRDPAPPQKAEDLENGEILNVESPESSEPVEMEPEEVSEKVMRILRRSPE